MNGSIEGFLSKVGPVVRDNDGVAMYLLIADAITASIERGDLAPGDRLPAERNLADTLDVSRDTLRQALNELHRHGRIDRTVGRGGGTFVAQPKYDRTVTHRSHSGYAGLADQLRDQNLTSSARVLLAHERTASPAVAAALQVGPGSQVYEVHRVRSANGRPVALERTAYPAHRVPGLLDQPLDGSIYQLLRSRYGINPDRALEWLEPILAGAAEVETLAVDDGAPLMYIERIVYDVHEVPIEFSRDVFRGDRTRIVVVGHGVETQVLPTM